MKENKKDSRSHNCSSVGSGNNPWFFTGLGASARVKLKAYIFRWFLFAVLWWGLSAGVVSQLFLMIFFISLAALLSTILIPVQGLRASGILGFVPFFISQSVLGGMDVAFRAFRPSMPLKTGFINYPLGLTHPTARVIFVWVVSLLPGTASVQLVEQDMRVHVLDLDLPHEQTLKSLEKNISALFRH